MRTYLGDFPVGAIVRTLFDTAALGGAPITVTDVDVVARQDDDATPIAIGITVTVDHAGTGIHLIEIDTAEYAEGSDYCVVIEGTVNGVAIRQVDAQFSVANRPTWPSASAIAAALLDSADGVEEDLTPREALRLIVAAAAGKRLDFPGPGWRVRDVADSKDVLTGTSDAQGNTTALEVDKS